MLLYQKGLLRYVVPALGLWLAVENVLIYPHYLSYVNEVAGGPRNAYRHLVDSAVDWGQDLPALEVFLAKNVPDQSDAYLSYFGTADPIAYGVRALILPSFLPRLTEKAMPDMPLLHAGFYCISVTMLQNLYNLEFAGPYTPAYEKVYQAMRRDIVHRDQSLQDQRFPHKTAPSSDTCPNVFGICVSYGCARFFKNANRSLGRVTRLISMR